MKTQTLRSLEQAQAHLSPEQLAQLPEDRRPFFEGLAALASGDVEQATKQLRRATRQAKAPYDTLSQVALGECERLRGKEGMAIKAWKSVAQDEQAPESSRYLAWLSIAALEETRQDERAAQAARQALEQLDFELPES